MSLEVPVPGSKLPPDVCCLSPVAHDSSTGSTAEGGRKVNRIAMVEISALYHIGGQLVFKRIYK